MAPTTKNANATPIKRPIGVFCLPATRGRGLDGGTAVAVLGWGGRAGGAFADGRTADAGGGAADGGSCCDDGIIGRGAPFAPNGGTSGWPFKTAVSACANSAADWYRSSTFFASALSSTVHKSGGNVLPGTRSLMG